MKALSFTVQGTPVGEPRHRARVVQPKGGKAIATMYPDKKADPWKQAVRQSASICLPDTWQPLDTPCYVQLSFRMPRPLAHHVAGKAERPLKDTAPTFHDKKPDADNLAKAVLDALTAWPKGQPALVFTDDCRVAKLDTEKRYCEFGESPGCTITIGELGVSEIAD